MQSNNLELKLACASRIAKANHVSVEAVLAKFRSAVRKSAFSYNDFFWRNSDISLRNTGRVLRGIA